MKALKKKTLKLYQAHHGNFHVGSTFSLKKESDLSTLYYPGIEEVLDKIDKKPANQHKYCSLPFTVGIISSCKTIQYPIISAQAALLSHTAGLNVIPLTLKYGKPNNIPTILNQLSPNFQAYYLSNISEIEEVIIRSNAKSISLPILFQHEALAHGSIAGVLAAAKMLKKSPSKLKICLEGADRIAREIAKHLPSFKCTDITLIDEQGALYPRRPKMNQEKIRLAKLLKTKKDPRNRSDILAESDIYISTLPQNISSELTSQLSDKAVIISLKALEIHKQGKQSIISTLPHLENHISDLHLATLFLSAACSGKKMDENIMKKATLALAGFYSSPKPQKLIPGLLEKKLHTKGLKGM